MKTTCPACGGTYFLERADVARDLAVCRGCGEAFCLSEALNIDHYGADMLASPPAGAWIEQDHDGFAIGTSSRSPARFILVPAMALWSGILIVILGAALATGEKLGSVMLAAIPFLLFSIPFWSFALMATWGKVVLRARGDRGEIFVGLGVIGWRRRFNWGQVHALGIGGPSMLLNYPGAGSTGIVLEGAGRLRFGTNLSEQRRDWVMIALMLMKLRHTARGSASSL